MAEDYWWKNSKAPVLLVRRDSDRRLGWQANDAARSWAREHEFDDSELDRLATDVGGLGDEHLDGALGLTPARNGEIHWHAVPWADGWLAWCLPDLAFVPTPEEKLDRLDILRRFGRIGMVGVDPVTGYALWDANACQLWGFDPLGQRPSLQQIIASIHADDRPRVSALLTSRSEEGYASERFRVRLKTGQVRHLHAMLKAMKSASGAELDVAGVIIDDTKTVERYLAQRKVAEAALNALELAGVAVWRQDPKGSRIIGDNVFRARMQVPHDRTEIDNDWVMAQYHPDDRAAAREANQKVLQQQGVVDAVLRIAGDDAQTHRTLLTRRAARRDAKGHTAEVVGVSMDISALVRGHDSAQAWARRAELAATASGVGLWVLDPRSGAGEWDRLTFQLHGRDPKFGTPTWSAWLDEYVDASDRPELSASRRLGADPTPFRGRCRIRRGDAEERWIEVVLQPESTGGSLRWLVTVADIHDKVSSSALLRIEQQRARFAADAAHLGLWECTTEGVPMYWSERMYALLGITTDLHQHSLREWWAALRPAAARYEIERRIRLHVERRDTLEHEAQINWPDGSVRWIALRARILPGPAGRNERMHGVCWDVTERRLAEVENHKIEAALTEARARARVTAQLGHDLRTSLNTVIGFSDLAAFSPEVPAQAREWLAKVRVAGGELLRQLATLEEHSTAGHSGAPPAPPAPATTTAQSLAALSPLTVVYIEDNSLNLLLVENLVATRRHITLKSAVDGRRGFEAVRLLRPDVVLVDIQLPDISGLEVVRRIRSEPRLASTRCIALSADNSPVEIERALAAGFDDYWTKPLDTYQFLNGLDALAQGQPLTGGLH